MRKKTKGVALLWALVISAIFLVISGNMVGYIIKESQTTIRIEDSTQAYAAAKSGADWAKYFVRNNDTLPSDPYTKTITVNGITTTITITKAGGRTKVTSIAAIGSSVRRKLEYTYDPKPSVAEIKPTAQVTDVTGGAKLGSFTLEFDFWNPGANFGIGLTNTNVMPLNKTVDKHISMNITSATTLQANPSGIAPQIVVPSLASYAAYDPENIVFYHAVLNYKKGTSTTLTIYEKQKQTIGGRVTEVLHEVGSNSVDLTDQDFSDLRYLYLDSYQYGKDPSGAFVDGSFVDVNDTYINNIFLR